MHDAIATTIITIIVTEIVVTALAIGSKYTFQVVDELFLQQVPNCPLPAFSHGLSGLIDLSYPELHDVSFTFPQQLLSKLPFFLHALSSQDPLLSYIGWQHVFVNQQVRVAPLFFYLKFGSHDAVFLRAQQSLSNPANSLQALASHFVSI